MLRTAKTLAPPLSVRIFQSPALGRDLYVGPAVGDQTPSPRLLPVTSSSRREKEEPAETIVKSDAEDMTPLQIVIVVGVVLPTASLVVVVVVVATLKRRRGSLRPCADPESAATSMIVHSQPEEHREVDATSDQFSPSPVSRLPHAVYTQCP